MTNALEKGDFDVIILAGQSNAQGCGLGDETLAYIKDDRIYRIADKNPIYYENLETNPTLKITLPMEKVFSVAEERQDGGRQVASFGLYFAKEYVEQGYLKNGRKLLLLECAVGGTGFSRNEWGVNGYLYNRLKDVVNYALRLGGANRLVAFLWHQGEHDSFEQKELTASERYAYYYRKLSEQMNDFVREYGNVPIIAGEMCPSCVNENPISHKAVEQATRDYFKVVFGSEIASAEGLQSNDDRIHNKDREHFCRKDCIELAKRYFEIYKGRVS